VVNRLVTELMNLVTLVMVVVRRSICPMLVRMSSLIFGALAREPPLHRTIHAMRTARWRQAARCYSMLSLSGMADWTGYTALTTKIVGATAREGARAVFFVLELRSTVRATP
jgi:hypothetical protein